MKSAVILFACLIFAPSLLLAAGFTIKQTYKKECAVYAGELDVQWRGLTISEGDIIDLDAIPEEDMMDFYSEIYMDMVKNDLIDIVDCTEE